MKKKKPLLILKGKGHTKENIELKARKDAYFQAMLILKYHRFGKRLFSSHAYFQVHAYFRENTVCYTPDGLFRLNLYKQNRLLPWSIIAFLFSR